MNAIKYTTEQELDQEDQSKLQEYKSKVSNSEAFLRFASKFQINGGWYMNYDENLSEYYTTEEIERVEEINLEETE